MEWNGNGSAQTSSDLGGEMEIESLEDSEAPFLSFEITRTSSSVSPKQQQCTDSLHSLHSLAGKEGHLYEVQ